MKWFEYQMEVDQLHAPDELKARLLAMQPDTQKSQNHSESPAKKDRTVRFPHWRRWAAGIAACAAVAVVGSQVMTAMHPAGAGISTMSLMDGGAASSTAASQAPALAQYSMDAAENGLAGGLTRSAAGTESAVAGDKIIYTARLTLETKDYDAARAALEQALADAGGWMENSSESSYDDSSRSLSMTLRVPAENYESFLTAAGQAASLVNRSESADDVTAQYTDVAGRIANLEGQRDRLRELQASAGTLSDLLDEVSVDAARFFFNSRSSTSALDFDLDLAVRQDSDNPVYYVQYAHARICSLVSRLAEEGALVPDAAAVDAALFETAEEKALIKTLSQLPEVIRISARDYDPSHVNRYLITLAGDFHRFYNACRIKGEEAHVLSARLKLADTVRSVIANCLALIGVTAPEKM